MRHSRVEFVAALFVIVFSLTLLPLTASAASANDVLAQARQLEATGQFKVAAQILRSAIADHSTPDPHRKLEFELDRLDRIRLDYSLTEDSLFAEAPHVVFTPQMRALSAQIVGNEKNPSRIAKKIYDWIGTNIHYSFATEYSTIDNISDYVLTHRYGDCGEESLFFITLCRLNNIPARWQSGWDIFPGKEDIHDWSEIYLAPYGWIPVDPCMGLLSEQYMTTLSRPERLELHNFYFGGLDEYRMAANANHSQLLTPPKNSFRSDNVDFQRGELESYNQDIYFNHYSYRWSIHQISK